MIEHNVSCLSEMIKPIQGMTYRNRKTIYGKAVGFSFSKIGACNSRELRKLRKLEETRSFEWAKRKERKKFIRRNDNRFRGKMIGFNSLGQELEKLGI